jgi:hypothetical protein
MKLQRLTTPAVMMLALTMAAAPAFAQSGDSRRSRDRSPRTADSGSQARADRGSRAGRDVAVSRSDARQQSGRPAANDGRNRATENRGYSGGQSGNRSGASGLPGGGSYRPGNNRSGNAGNRGYDNRSYNNRGYDNRAYDRGYNSRVYSNRGYSGRDYGRYGSYDRDRWRGRVRFGLNVSIFAGSPFRFRFDYGWRPSFSYYYTMRPGLAYGGMSFLLQPDYAEVYIDGEFVGNARDFGGQPVPVAAGYHRIELYAPGFEPTAFDINVLPGQVIPYRGSLYPEAYR